MPNSNFGDTWKSDPALRERFYGLEPEQQTQFLKGVFGDRFPQDPAGQQKIMDTLTEWHLSLTQKGPRGEFQPVKPVTEYIPQNVPQVWMRDMEDSAKNLAAFGTDAAKAGGRLALDIGKQTVETFKEPSMLYAAAYATLMAAYPPARAVNALTRLGLVSATTLGAVLGGMTGESVEIIDESLRKEVAGKTVESVLKRVATEGIVQGAYELFANAFILPFTLMSGAMRKRVAPNYLRIMQIMRERGVDVPLAQIVNYAPIDLAHNFASGSWFGQKRMRDYMSDAVRADGSLYDSAIDFMRESARSMGDREAGELLADLIAGARVTMTEIEKQLFGVVEQLDAGGVMVDLYPMGLTLERLDKEFAAINYFGLSSELKELFKTARSFMDPEKITGVRTVIEGTQAHGAPKIEVPFSQAHLLSSMLKEVQRGFKSEGAGRVAKAYNEAIGILDDMIETAAAEFRPAAAKTYIEAKNLTTRKYEVFSTDLAQALLEGVKNKPAALETAVFVIKEAGDAQMVKDFKKIVVKASALQGVPAHESWSVVRGQYIKSLLDEASTVGSITTTGAEAAEQVLFRRPRELEKGLLDPQKLTKIINDPKRRFVHQEFLPGDMTRNLLNYAEAAQVARAEQAGGAKMVAQLMQGGAILGVFSELGFGAFSALTGSETAEERADIRNKTLVTGGMIMIGPSVMARMLLSKRATRWLIEGLKEPIGTQRALAVLSRIAGYAIANGGQLVSQPSQNDEYGVPDSYFKGGE